MLTRLSGEAIERVVRMALEEDAPWGDATSEALIPVEARVAARLVAREAGVLCGEDLFRAAMEAAGEHGGPSPSQALGSRMTAKNEQRQEQPQPQIPFGNDKRGNDRQISVVFAVRDGERFEAGAVLATVEGPARAVLLGERIALNFAQRLSGIATLTARYVAAVAGTNARIVDTRKTTPGLRLLERYAVRCGGGFNHRFSLSDAVMAKDNHLALLTAGGLGLTEALRAARARLSHTTHVEVEVDRLNQIEAVLAAGVDTIMLDNFSPENLRAGVRQVAGRALVEASGGVTLESVAEIAAAGVDVISVGALTHSVRALDLGLDIL